MQAYLIRRVLWLIPVLIAVSLITFLLMHAVPGGPFDSDSRTLPAAVLDNLNRKYGLDRPLYEQYGRFLLSAVQGDLGVSYSFQDRGVTQIILQGLPVTATLGITAFLISVVVGMGLGIVASLKPNSWLDYLSVFFSTVGGATPNFIAGIVLVIIFGVTLHLLPTGGWGTPDKIILPAIALALYPTAYIARLTRGSMLEVLHQDYIRTARSKGISERRVVLRHVIKNGLIPVLTVLGPYAAYFATGSFIIEQLFSIPGIGRTFVIGVQQRDYGLIMGTTLLYAAIVAVANLAIDLFYAVVDPRIRYS